MTSLYLDHVGIEDGDELPFTIRTEESHGNRNGTVHGGFLATMMDTACGREVRRGLEEGQETATVALTVTYLRPGKVGSELTASASTLHRGDSLVMVEGEIVDADGERVAHASATFAVIDAD